MALLKKHRRHMGDAHYCEPVSGRVLRREAKCAPVWAVSADGTSGKTFMDNGLLRVRVGFSQFVCENGKVVGEVAYKTGELLVREGFFHHEHGLALTLDLRLRDGEWYALLPFERGGARWLKIADCRGLGGIAGIKPGCTTEIPGEDTWTDDPDSMPAPTYEELIEWIAMHRRPTMGMPRI